MATEAARLNKDSKSLLEIVRDEQKYAADQMFHMAER